MGRSISFEYFLGRRGRAGLVAAAVFFALLVMALQGLAATLPAGFTEGVLASGLTQPTAMAFTPDGRILVCQQTGALRVIKNGALLPTPFVTLTVSSLSERGLLGIAVDPNFEVNQYIYVYYTATTPAIHNRVSRFTADGDVAVLGSELILFDLNNLSAGNHNGGALHFGPDGKLYFAAGENAVPSNAQSIANVLGKIMRINSDGTIPADNPASFPGIAGSTTGIQKAIWSVGLRNPYTFAFQPGTGRMFINDVGNSTWEEINDGIAGSNYGWPACESFCSPTDPNYRDPLFRYGHGASATTGCAITGGAFYNPTNAMFPADYVGKYFYGEYCTGWIRRFDPATSTDQAFATGISAPLDILIGIDGSLYYLANGIGSVVRVTYGGPTPTPTATPTNTPTATPTNTPTATPTNTPTATPTPVRGALFDYDGDRKADISVYRPSNGLWYLQRSRAGETVIQLGNSTDKIAPADFDGDGKTDIAVYRPSQGTWYVFNSSTSVVGVSNFGVAEDIAAPGDYDGDGKADIAIYRPSTATWWLNRSTAGLIAVQFGLTGDMPVPGDFDGDGKADLVVYRPSNGVWYMQRSTAGGFAIQFGNSTDKIVPADYDGDGKMDVAIYRASQTTWYAYLSSNGAYPVQVFGQATDIPVPADYDGDGRADIAIFRPSNGQWWIDRTGSGLIVVQYGSTGDKPTENAYGN